MNRYISVVLVYIAMAYKVYWLNKASTRKLIEEINDHLKLRGVILNQDQTERIRTYTTLITITNSWFAALRGHKLTRRERTFSLYAGALTSFFDDLTDSSGLKSDAILHELNSPDPGSGKNMLVTRYLYDQVKKNCSEEFLDCYKKAAVSQDASLHQLGESTISDDELRTIIYSKGVTCTLLWRKALDNPLIDGEEAAICSLGVLLQLTNDMFDVYKDYENKQQTLYTNSKDLANNYDEYKALYAKMNTQFVNLGYEKKSINKFLLEISVVVGRGMVCSEQLMRCQRSRDNQFNLEGLPRKELICDMEKITNIVKSVKNSVLCYKQIALLPIGSR